MATTLNKLLFFSDVPDGTLKHKPIVRPSAVDLTGVVNNLGQDLSNALFFDDLQSICNQKPDPFEQKGNPKDAFKPLEELKEDDPQPWPSQPFQKLTKSEKTVRHEEKEEVPDYVTDEESNEIYSLGKTIPPPALGRVQKVNEELEKYGRKAELLEIARGLERQRKDMEKLMVKVKQAADL
jgi:hypothetical protein